MYKLTTSILLQKRDNVGKIFFPVCYHYAIQINEELQITTQMQASPVNEDDYTPDEKEQAYMDAFSKLLLWGVLVLREMLHAPFIGRTALECIKDHNSNGTYVKSIDYIANFRSGGSKNAPTMIMFSDINFHLLNVLRTIPVDESRLDRVDHPGSLEALSQLSYALSMVHDVIAEFQKGVNYGKQN